MATRILSLCALVLGLAFAAGCSPARTGLSGDTLSTNTRPPISITAHEPLRPVADGRLSARVPNDTETLPSSFASFNYAVFSDASDSGLVTRHAHAILSRLEDSANWRFAPDTWRAPGAFTPVAAGSNPNLLDYSWSTQLLRTPSQGDWFSDLWTANGRDVPEFWLVRRWTALLNDSNRAVLEYREPWPECMESGSPELTLLGGTAADCLNAFDRRAASAFSAAALNTPLGGTSAQLLQAAPSRLPNMRNLVGEAVATNRRSGGNSRD